MKLRIRRSRRGYETDPYCVHTEEGEVLPRQRSVTITQRPDDLTTVTVEFIVDDDDVVLEDSRASKVEE